MSDKEAGWYPDPDGENRQRYWDGDSWSDYYTPLASAPPEVHGASTATEDYPYLTTARAGAQHGRRGPSSSGWGRSGWPGVAGGPPGQPGQTQEFSGGGRRSSATRWAIVAATVLVVGLVAGVLWWAIRGGAGGEDPTSGPTGPAPTDGATTTGEIVLGEDLSAELDRGGLWIGDLALDADTTVVLDARADDSQDLVIEVRPAGGGDVIARNDDRGRELEEIGGGSLDPLLATTLPAGDYAVEITERSGEATDLTLASTAVTATVTEAGEPLALTVPDGGGVFAAMVVDADGRYQVDVTSLGDTTDGDEPDPYLVLLGPDGSELTQDDRDRDGGDYDPLYEGDLVAGTWVVVVFEVFDGGMDVSVDLSAA